MERKAQYKKKMNYIIEMQQLLAKPKNIDQRDALFYRVETAIEAAMDLVAMLIKDRGRTVGDDYHNIDTLLEIGIIKATLASELKKLNGLRNALVHRYNKFEETTVTQHTEQISSLHKISEKASTFRWRMNRSSTLILCSENSPM